MISQILFYFNLSRERKLKLLSCYNLTYCCEL